MEARKDNMMEFLGTPKAMFVVPVYQRNYTWGESQCRRLFHDMCNTLETGRPHFLGTVCYTMDDDRKRFVIDGQQRLTSITLLLKALRDFADFMDDSELCNEIESNYLRNHGVSVNSEFEKYKLHLNARDDEVFHLLLNHNGDSIEDAISLSQHLSGVYRNYVLFYDMVKEYSDNGGQIRSLLGSLQQLILVSLILDNENPQEIFESLNSTGMDLSPVDLLRNSFLMRFPYDVQVKLYEHYWMPIEGLIGVEYMDMFFVHYLIAKRRHHKISIDGRRKLINSSNMAVAFEDVLERFFDGDTVPDKICAMLEDMLVSARLYKNLIFDDEFVLDQTVSRLSRSLYFLIVINDCTPANSLLLYLFWLHRDGKITDDDLQQAVDAILSLVFRSKTCRHTGINNQFVTSILWRLEKIQDYNDFQACFWEAITSGRGLLAFPSDKDFMHELLYSDLYTGKLKLKCINYFLYSLEMASAYPKSLPLFNDKDTTVEHIMPQKLSKVWKKSLSKESMRWYATYLHTCGNLALTSYNSEMSNKSFMEKCTYYGNSNFYHTRKLTEYNDWQVEDIKKRGEELARVALTVWKLPSEYQSCSNFSSTLHGLGEDSSLFTNCRPSVLLIGDAEISVSNWIELVMELVKYLDNIDHDMILSMAKNNKVRMIRASDNDHDYSGNSRYKLLTDNIYVVCYSSTSQKLDALAGFVTFFDHQSGTNYMNDIMFQLK